MTMKKTIFSLLAIAAILFVSSCDKDPYELDLQIFDVRWFDDDQSGDQTVGDALTFAVQVNSTAPSSDDQYITEWDFSYFVNGDFGGLLQGDDFIETNSFSFDAVINIGNLALPGPGALGKGDVVEFRLWVRDNYGTELEHTHRYVIEN